MADANVQNPLTCMESVNRVAKFPVVESSIHGATNLYEKVKEYNSLTNWTMSTAENTVNKALEIGKPYAAPVVRKLDGPLKKVDGALCTGLDYVEAKVPAVKLPPAEMLTTTKDYVNNTVTPAVENASKSVHGIVDPAMQAAKSVVDPAVQAAKQVVEPAVGKAYKIVEPVVQPALEKAQALKDYGVQKVEEYLGQSSRGENEGETECKDCKEDMDKTNE